MNILIIDTAHPILQQKLEQAGFSCDYLPDLSINQIEDMIHGYDGIIGRSKIGFCPSLIDKAERLKFIGRLGAGMENIDLIYAEKKGIMCFNSPEGNRDAVGEHTMALLLNLLNNINIADNEVRNMKWHRESNRGIELKDKTVGIIGYGNMGSAFAQRMKGFGVKVLAFDKYKTGFSDGFVSETNMQLLFENADIVSIHVPLTCETQYMCDDVFFGKFRKPIIFINTSRGKVVRTDDLVKNLKSGQVSGAALDVLEYENESFENFQTESIPASLEFLLSCSRTVLTPHIAGWTVESKYKLAAILADKIITAFSS